MKPGIIAQRVATGVVAMGVLAPLGVYYMGWGVGLSFAMLFTSLALLLQWNDEDKPTSSRGPGG